MRKAMVSSVDEAVGNIIETLEATGAVSRVFCNSEQTGSKANDNSIDNMAALLALVPTVDEAVNNFLQNLGPQCAI